MIRLSKSTVGIAEKKAVLRVLEEEFLGMGTEVRSFEEELTTFIGGNRQVVAVNTGTAALHLALQVAGVGPGDEVLVPTITYVASFQAISATGARPVACDVLPESLFLDLDDAKARITAATKAIMPVHYASNSIPVAEVYAFARDYGLTVIEDAAHSFGCQRDGQNVGVEGDLLCFSFDGIKNITSGEGGAVVTGNMDWADRVRDARLLGVQKDTEKRYQGGRSWEFDVSAQGYRYHMSNLMAAIGRAQLSRFGEIRNQRQQLVRRYLDMFASVVGVTPLPFNYQEQVSHIFVVKVASGKRDGLRNHLAQHGIETGVHYFPNHRLAYFKTPYPLPAAEKAHGEILSLPLHLDLTEVQQVKIVQELGKYLK